MVREFHDALFPLVGANLCVRPQVGLKREGTQNRHVAEFADQLDGGQPAALPGLCPCD